MHPLTLSVIEQYRQNANAEKAPGAKAYMLNQFEFFGIPAPQRSTINKAIIKQHLIEDVKQVEVVVKELWKMPEREYQYFAVALFAYYKKLWKPSSIKLMEYCITHKSWWDSVDNIASEWTGPFFKLFPGQKETITAKWNQSSDMWLQRSSIMFQKAYKKETDTELLSRYILNCKDSKEFFIQKAIGWALREYSKTNPQWVTKFVKQNKLAPLSAREAMKRILKESEK